MTDYIKNILQIKALPNLTGDSTEIRNSKLNLVIIKPPRLLSNLGGSLHQSKYTSRFSSQLLLYQWSLSIHKSLVKKIEIPSPVNS